MEVPTLGAVSYTHLPRHASIQHDFQPLAMYYHSALTSPRYSFSEVFPSFLFQLGSSQMIGSLCVLEAFEVYGNSTFIFFVIVLRTGS